MDNVPYEILELILGHSILNERDVINFSSTCSLFRNIVNSNSAIWKKKFFQRWRHPPCKKIMVDDWRKEFMERVDIERKTMEILSQMSSKFYMLSELCDTDLAYVNDFVNSTCNSYYYVVDYLIRLNSMNIPNTMTIKYYGNKLLHHIKKKYLNKIWLKLIEMDDKFLTLEKGAIFLSQWFETSDELIEETVVHHLNFIASMVKRVVGQRYKDHPLTCVPREESLKWVTENIPGNIFSSEHCKQILSCISFVLFEEMEYYIINDLFEPPSILNIDSAISERKATPLMCCVIYESIARRLGVKCEIISFPAHCLLRWKEEYSNEDTPYHYIDMSGKNTFLKPECCSRNMQVVSQCPIKKPSFQCLNMQQVAEKAAQDMLYAERVKYGINHVSEVNHVSDVSILELLLLFSPTSLELYRQLGRYYMRKEMDISGLIEKMTHIMPQILTSGMRLYEGILAAFYEYVKNWEESKLNSVKVKRRTAGVEFAVGMIGRHKIYDYTCVVYGWDPVCKASQHWILQNGVLNLPSKDQQPFYNVLAHDGTERYVAQENLHIIHSPPLICHPEIGHYFEDYCTTYYKPNKQLQDEYPEDGIALEKLLRRRE